MGIVDKLFRKNTKNEIKNDIVSQRLNFLEEIKKDNKKINDELIEKIEKKYNCKLPEDVKKIISVTDDFYSFEDLIIRMDNDIILNPEEELFCNIMDKNIIPIFDCYDNDYICYDFVNNNWCMFNSVDESIYDTNKNILGLSRFE